MNRKIAIFKEIPQSLQEIHLLAASSGYFLVRKIFSTEKMKINFPHFLFAFRLCVQLFLSFSNQAYQRAKQHADVVFYDFTRFLHTVSLLNLSEPSSPQHLLSQ